MEPKEKKEKLCPLRPFKLSDHVDAAISFHPCLGEVCAWYTYERIPEEHDILEGCALIFLAKQTRRQ